MGVPIDPNPFELHELDNIDEGVKNSKSRPSGRPSQRGDTLPPSPIITGLDKTELVFREPFFTNFLSFFSNLNSCSHLMIAGYGFGDRHVNMGIQQLRENRPTVKTYIVTWTKNDDPSEFLASLSPDAWATIIPDVDAHYKAKRVEGHPEWWLLPGNKRKIKTGDIFLWAKGFDTFCTSVIANGLP